MPGPKKPKKRRKKLGLKPVPSLRPAPGARGLEQAAKKAWADAAARWPSLRIGRLRPSIEIGTVPNEKIEKMAESGSDLMMMDGVYVLEYSDARIALAVPASGGAGEEAVARMMTALAFKIATRFAPPVGEGFFRPDSVPVLFSLAIRKPFSPKGAGADQWMAGSAAYCMGEQEFVRAYVQGDEFSIMQKVDAKFGTGTFFTVSSAWMRGESSLLALSKKVVQWPERDAWFDEFSVFMGNLGWDVRTTMIPVDSARGQFKSGAELFGSRYDRITSI